METITAAEARKLLARPKRNKYRAKPTVVDGIRFASQGEAAWFMGLRQQEQAGIISKLNPHPRFDLHANGCHIAFYTADAEWVTADGVYVVADFKGAATAARADWARTKRLFKACHGFEITECRG